MAVFFKRRGNPLALGKKLSEYAVGSTVYLNENGNPVEFYVAKHDYESDLNGTGRTLLVRKDSYQDSKVWHSSNKNAYATSDIDAWLNGEYKSLLDVDVQTTIATTQFYYTGGNGDTAVKTLNRSVFLLSVTELGRSNSNANGEGSALSIAPMLRIAYKNGAEYPQWTRTPYNDSYTKVFDFNAYGTLANNDCTVAYGARPCFTLPNNAIVNKQSVVTGRVG